jgi:hypothetical protein
MKKFLIYAIKWQGGTPIMALCLWVLPLDGWLKVIVGNIIGAIIFFPIDSWIFRKKG